MRRSPARWTAGELVTASAALRADRAPMPQVAKPRAGLSSDQRIVSPGSRGPVTGVDLFVGEPLSLHGQILASSRSAIYHPPARPRTSANQGRTSRPSRPRPSSPPDRVQDWQLRETRHTAVSLLSVPAERKRHATPEFIDSGKIFVYKIGSRRLPRTQEITSDLHWSPCRGADL
jgi:hypothetical protein